MDSSLYYMASMGNLLNVALLSPPSPVGKYRCESLFVFNLSFLRSSFPLPHFRVHLKSDKVRIKWNQNQPQNCLILAATCCCHGNGNTKSLTQKFRNRNWEIKVKSLPVVNQERVYTMYNRGYSNSFQFIELRLTIFHLHKSQSQRPQNSETVNPLMFIDLSPQDYLNTSSVKFSLGCDNSVHINSIQIKSLQVNQKIRKIPQPKGAQLHGSRLLQLPG